MTAINPILNGPYDEPTRHYATDPAGNLDYTAIRQGRRLFAPDVPQVPLGKPVQPSMFDLNDLKAEYRDEIINLLREEITAWRTADYPGITSRVTRTLLDFWFKNPERASWQRLFFAQQEAIEAAIWLNEVAHKSNKGTHLLSRIRLANQTVSETREDWLPRIAFKMATGTGKTVVMACLILYHYLNRQEYRSDTRFSDYFLLIAPGITIRDRLSVLLFDETTDHPQEARDYYRQRHLVPRDYLPMMHSLNARIIITNYHTFEPRLLGGNKKTPFDGKLDATGQKQEARENMAQVLKRVLSKFKPGRRLLVINDEAHHCYLPKEKGRDTEEAPSETENARAAVWFSGLRAIAGRYQVNAVYDLSATPYYLYGSGYPAYAFFPWIVTDFGLIEAIEAGLVKIPFLPVDDSSQQIEEPVLRELYKHSRNDLPKKGQRSQRKADKAEGRAIIEAPPQLPDLVRIALEQFVDHYQKYDQGERHRGERKGDLLTEPPVFIVVCNNTTVSKEVYKYIAGYDIDHEDGSKTVRPGQFDIFSNYDPLTHQPRAKPPTLLIDSDALENAGQIDEDFKRVFATEIEQFKREYRNTHPGRSLEALSDADLLREVVNTVGKRGQLGAHVRCVVSVSMLTEGWDANTVTHIMGLRAFGSQLLCEQVAGRALRRRDYLIDPKTGKFPPEYAHIIGVPFKFFKGGVSEPPERLEYQTLRALPERAELEIRFPNLIGYRIETRADTLHADFSTTPNYRFSLNDVPAETVLGSAFTAETQRLNLLEKLETLRDQQVIFKLTQALLKKHYSGEDGAPMFEHFQEVRPIVETWYQQKVELVGETDPVFKRALYYLTPGPIADSIQQGINSYAAQEERILPLYNYYNRIGSSAYVHGHTSKATYPTKKSHVNLVAADTDAWEQIAAKTLEQMPLVESYVKNAFLGFQVPYSHNGKESVYLPDYIARIKTPEGSRFNLIIEITGFSRDKKIKKFYLEHRWLRAVNAAREGLKLDPWYFIEITDIEHIKKQLKEKIAAIAAEIDDRASLEDLMRAQWHDLLKNWDDQADDLFSPL